MSEQALTMSPEIGELAAALAAAQGEITGALKDSKNPFFKSSYADLASCWESCRAPLSKNGLAVIQTTQEAPEGVKVLTTLAHKSGQWIRGELPMKPVKNDPQGIGSCITYARRYALAAIVGLAQIDDDANAASGKEGEKSTSGVHSGKPDGWNAQDTRKTAENQKRIHDAVNEGRDVLEVWDEVVAGGETFATAVWSKLSAPVKEHIKDQKEKRGKRAA